MPSHHSPLNFCSALVLSALALACCAGCDTSLQPGDRVYALENPTREWRIPDQRTIEAARNKQLNGKTKPTETNESAADETIVDPAKLSDLLKETQHSEPLVSVNPPMLTAERARPDRPTEMKVFVSSKDWQTFELRGIESDLQGVTWQMEPADDASLEYLQAKSGWLLKVELPPGLEPGKLLGHSLMLLAENRDDRAAPRQQHLEIPIEANVLRRLAAYGGDVDETGTIQFGVQPTGVAHKKTLMLKVHDPVSELKLQEVVADPAFVETKMTPYGSDADGTNLYQLDVVLPADAPEHVSRRGQLGSILLKFDHPRIDELKLNVDFVLHGRANSRSLVDVD